MSERDYLSDFEQLVMLAVLQRGEDAYGAKIRQTLDETAGRGVSIATIYVALGRLEERRQQLQPSGQVADGFLIGRTPRRVLAGLLPVANGLVGAGRLGIVMR